MLVRRTTSLVTSPRVRSNRRRSDDQLKSNKDEKLVNPAISVFIITPGAVCAIYVRSLPGFGTWETCSWFTVVDTSPFSALMSGASSVTLTVVGSADSRTSWTFMVAGGPREMARTRLVALKPGWETVSVKFPGRRNEYRYPPSAFVVVDCVSPLALSFSSTIAFGTTAPLGSLTTPVRPPLLVV